jgi:hypothetical protein
VRTAIRTIGWEDGVVPLVDVTFDSSLTEVELSSLADALPDLVAQAVECPEEPWTGPPQAGDIEIRFRPKSAHDVGELKVVIEVRTRLLAGRLDDPQRRADLVRAGLDLLDVGPIGVWLILVEGAWSQT